MAETITIQNAGRTITIERDASGVPHIRASRWVDALFGLGYMQARDRLTQVFFSRAVASGRAAELIADKAELFETDCFFRRVGLHRRLDEDVALLEDCAGADRNLLRGDQRGHSPVRPKFADVGDGISTRLVGPAGRLARR